MITSGLLTHFRVDSGRALEFEAALASALPLVARERSTFVWFAVRFASSEYGILDFFPNEQARAVHVAGPVGQLVLGEGGPSLAAPPRVEEFDLVAHCFAANAPSAPVNKAAMLTFTVRKWRNTEIEALLRQCAASADQEQAIAWLGMTFGEQRYGMFAAFRDETSRSLYLARGAPHELARHAAPSLDGDVADARLIDVVAAKLSVG